MDYATHFVGLRTIRELRDETSFKEPIVMTSPIVNPWISLLGGVALFTVGLAMTGDSLKTAAPNSVRNLLLMMTKNPVGSVVLGMSTTLLAGSSSAITVVVVGFVNAGLLELRQALDVMLGAAIGTTVTVQIVSFNTVRYAPLLILVGAIVMIIQRGRKKPSTMASLILGFGLIFYGMMVMIGAAAPLSSSPHVRHSLVLLNAIPLAGFLLALVVTAFIQNSATIIALAMTFRLHGLLSLPAGLAIVLGANIGSTAAAMYSALLGGSRGARRAAIAYSLMKTLGAIVFLLFMPLFQKFVMAIDPAPARTLADGHTLFNLINALLFLPFTGLIAHLMERWLPDRTPAPVSPLDLATVTHPQEALRSAHQEIGRLADMIATGLIDPLTGYLQAPGDDQQRHLAQSEEQVDLLHHAITAYLFRVSAAHHLDEATLARHVMFLYLANHLEHFSDTLTKVSKTRARLARRHFTWPPELWQDVYALWERLADQYARLTIAIRNNDDDLALDIVQEHPDLLRAESDVRVHILTHPEEIASQHMTLLLELSDDLQVLINRMATLSRALLGII